MVPGTKSSPMQKSLAILGCAILLVLAGWWSSSLYKGHLARGSWTWVPHFKWLGCDFDFNYYAVRHWFGGGDPYQGFPDRFSDHTQDYNYPPQVLLLFSWCGLVSVRTGYFLWLCFSFLVATLAGFLAWRTRKALGNNPVPFIFALAAVLGSYPIIFELERGNCNIWPLLFMILGLWAMRSSLAGSDYLAGALFAVAAWCKIYPGIVILAVVFLRRWRVASAFVIVGLAICLADVPHTYAFMKNLKRDAYTYIPNTAGEFYPWSHTISGCWKQFCRHNGIRGLGRLPGWFVWAGFCMPMIVWVSRRVVASPQQAKLLYPYFLWLVGVGTYLPAGANDYNLFFIPLAALIVWDRRDAWYVHLLMGSMLLWWQPLKLPIDKQLLWLSKLAAIHAVGLSLIARARVQEIAGNNIGPTDPLEAVPAKLAA